MKDSGGATLERVLLPTEVIFEQEPVAQKNPALSEEKSIPGKGNSKCKVPEVSKRLGHSRKKGCNTVSKRESGQSI